MNFRFLIMILRLSIIHNIFDKFPKSRLNIPTSDIKKLGVED
jgi:hypothetical protein